MPETELQPKPPIPPVVILTGSVAMLFISGGGMFLIAVALKDVSAEFGWPREIPSLAFSLQFIGSGIGGIVMGYVLDRFGFGVPAFIGAVMVGARLLDAVSDPLMGTISDRWRTRFGRRKIWLALSIAIPGMAGIAAKRPDLAMMGLLLFSWIAAVLVWPSGPFEDPLLMGGAAWVAFALPGVIAALAYAGVVVLGLILRKSR